MNFFKIHEESSGQALIIVIVVLVIIAIIATSVAFRTITDTKRTGKERASLDAFTYAESSIEDLSNQMKSCLGKGKQAGECLNSICGSTTKCTIKCETGSKCSLLKDFSVSTCNQVSVLLKTQNSVTNRTIIRDDVIEIPVSNQSGKSINIKWSGAVLETTFVSYSGSTGYSVSGNGGRVYYQRTGGKFSSGVVPGGSGFIANNGDITIAGGKFAGVAILRIKAIGADAVVSITGPVDPFEMLYSANGFCGNISRNVVVVEPVLDSMDGIFDYVLYSNVIEKDLPGN